MVNSNGYLEAGIQELFKEFVTPSNILDLCQTKKILSKEDSTCVSAVTKQEGDHIGAKCLFSKLAGKPDSFPALLEILSHPSVKLQHIAELMQEEQKFIDMGHSLPSRSLVPAPSPSSTYIKYNSELESKIHDLFLQCFTDHGLHAFRKYGDSKILTKIDIHIRRSTEHEFKLKHEQNVEAEIRNRGELEGTLLLLRRLVLYDGWFPVLLKVLRDDGVRQETVADEMETITFPIRNSYKKMTEETSRMYIIKHFNEQTYQINQQMDTDATDGGQIQRGGNNRSFLTSSSSGGFESDSAVVMDTVGAWSVGVISQSERLSQTQASSSIKTGLMIAAEKGNAEMLLSLISETSDIDESDPKERTALMYAAFRGRAGCVRLLISKGCDVNKVGENGNTALMLAVRNDQTECVAALIVSGADVSVPNLNGTTALMVAAKKGHDLSMRLLLEKKCDLDVLHPDGRTALMYAANYGHSDCVKLLIANGCNVNIPDRSMTTALIYSARGGHCKCIELLLDGQADINQLGKDGNTAIMLAIVNNHIPCVELFIKRGADLSIVNNYGDSPLDTARKMKNVECTRLIKNALLS